MIDDEVDQVVQRLAPRRAPGDRLDDRVVDHLRRWSAGTRGSTRRRSPGSRRRCSGAAAGRCSAPPYILRPTTRFAYCTGIRRWARSMSTIAPTTITAKTMKISAVMIDMAPVRRSSKVLKMARRQADHDAGEDDERDAVADAALGDLLAEPHDERGPGRQGQHREEAETPARVRHQRERRPERRSSRGRTRCPSDWMIEITTVP